MPHWPLATFKFYLLGALTLLPARGLTSMLQEAVSGICTPVRSVRTSHALVHLSGDKFVFAAEPTILGISRSQSEYLLRIDTDIFAADMSNDRAVQLLSLKDPVLEGDVDLRSWVGTHVEFEIDPARPMASVAFYLEKSADEVIIQCSSVRESYTAYTLDDLVEKVRLVTQTAALYAQSYESVKQRLYTLQGGLQQDIDRELDVATRRQAFFRMTNPAMAKALTREIDVLHRLRAQLSAPRPMA